MTNGIPPDVRKIDNFPTETGPFTGGEKEAFNLSKFLEQQKYPLSKKDILGRAEADMPAEIIEMLDQLPDAEYNSPTEVSQALGENSQVIK